MPDTLAHPAVEGPSKSGLTPVMLNHAAWITHDVAATTEFYTKVMGMELASTIFDDKVPSTGDAFPYFHIFFRMQDGSTIAFFEAPGLPPKAKSTHPAYDVFDHFAMQAKDADEVRRWHDWLTENGLDVLGPVDHKGEFLSIYFHDPNGIRLEITTPMNPEWNAHTSQGYADLEKWLSTKERAKAEGRDVSEALIELIAEERKRYEA